MATGKTGSLRVSFVVLVSKLWYSGVPSLNYDNVELIRGQIHAIRVTQRSKTAGNITISCNTTLCIFFRVLNLMEAYFLTLEINTRF